MNIINETLMSRLNFRKSLIDSIYEYNLHTSRSSKKVNIIHNYLKQSIEDILPKEFYIKTEQYIPYNNFSGRKKCDIVIYKNEEPYIIIIPVKFIMRNYKQNRNNYFENLVGEISGLKNANKDIKIIPFNIFIKNTPYFKSGNIFLKFEKEITYRELTIYDKIRNRNSKHTDKCENYVNILIEAEYLKTDVIKKNLTFNKILIYKSIINTIQEFLK